MKISQLIGILIILLLLLLGAVYALQERAETRSSPPLASVSSEHTTGTNIDRTEGSEGTTTVITREVVHIVNFTEDGFEPKQVAVQLGEKVKFVNTTDDLMWVASLPHDTHAHYGGAGFPEHCHAGGPVFDQCAPSDTYIFTFEQKGEWGFHNHLAAEHVGTVVVK